MQQESIADEERSPNSGMNQLLSSSVLKDAIRQVERDEARAIETLCELLYQASKSSDLSCLTPIQTVLKDWQNQPPGVIVRSLQKIAKEP